MSLPSTTGLLICLAAFILCIGNVASQTRRMDEFKRAVEAVNGGIEKFSLELILRTANSLPDKSVVLCPYSVWAMMSVLAEGARGKTLEEMTKTLRHPNRIELVRNGFKAITEAFLVNTSTIQLESVNALFLDRNKQIDRKYESLAQGSYLTRMHRVDFRNPQTTDYINNIIRQSTRDRVKEIVLADDLKGAEMIITNAVFFKGQWSFPFNSSLTKVENFHDESGRVVGQVNMMRRRAPYPYVNMKEFSSYIIELGYGKEGRLSMMLMLPYEGTPLSEIYKKFTKINVTEIFTALDEASQYDDEDVDVFLPRFNVESDITMNQLLNDMGMFEIFDPTYADLSGISSSLYLSRVIHKANIEVNEEGTVASAVTVGELSNRNTPPKFVANKPFIYLIIEKTTKVVVFGGVYRNPSVV